MGGLEDQDRRVIEYYRKAAENYDKEYDNPYFKLLYDRVTWRYIKPYLPREGLVLDAGGGTGKWAIPIAEEGLNVVIYDISEEMLNVALRKVRERGLEDRVKVRQGDICYIEYPNDYFDFVLAEGDPISYCSDPDKAVGELYRVLKPGCYAIAAVDSLLQAIRHAVGDLNLDLAFKILREKRFYASGWGFHCWAFTPKDLRQLFTRHGFDIVKIIGKTVVFFRLAEPLLHEPFKAEELLELELALCEEESIIGYGGHLHVVAKKPL